MKIECSKQPENYLEFYPGQHEIFSWMEYVSAIPQTMNIVTTFKKNKKANANLTAWSTYTGDRDGYYVILSLMSNCHTTKNILRNKGFIVNFPSQKDWKECWATVTNNSEDNDEIIDAGFTFEKGLTVNAPRIKECFLNLECTLDWDRPLHENSHWHIFAGKVKHVAIEKDCLENYQRYGGNGFITNLHGPLNPTTGKQDLSMVGIIEPKFNS